MSDDVLLPATGTGTADITQATKDIGGKHYPKAILYDESGVPLALNGKVSSGNSSTATLGNGAAFTGTFEEVKDYATVSVIVFANVASATDGLEFQWSSDGTNADVTEVTTVSAAAGRAFSLTPRARYFRIKYTNGGSGQTTFRLGTTYHPAGTGLISLPLDKVLTPENFAQTVRALLAAYDGTNFPNVRGSASAPAGSEFGLITRNIPSGVQDIDGNVAHDGADSGNPVKLGYKAIAHGSNPTAVAAGDRTDGYASRAGVPFTIGGHPNIVTIEAAFTGAQTDTALVTVGSGVKIVVTQIQVLTDNANTAFPQIRVGFGASNTPTTTGVVLTHPGLPAGGGVSRGDGSGILGIGADGEDLRVTCGAPTGGSLRVLASYYTIES